MRTLSSSPLKVVKRLSLVGALLLAGEAHGRRAGFVQQMLPMAHGYLPEGVCSKDQFVCFASEVLNHNPLGAQLVQEHKQAVTACVMSNEMKKLFGGQPDWSPLVPVAMDIAQRILGADDLVRKLFLHLIFPAPAPTERTLREAAAEVRTITSGGRGHPLSALVRSAWAIEDIPWVRGKVSQVVPEEVVPEEASVAPGEASTSGSSTSSTIGSTTGPSSTGPSSTGVSSINTSSTGAARSAVEDQPKTQALLVLPAAMDSQEESHAEDIYPPEKRGILSTQKCTLLYSHGNAESIATDGLLEFVARLADETGCAVLAYEYPGYNGVPGEKVIENVIDAAAGAAEYAAAVLGATPETTFLVGKSIGTKYYY